jgi:hypothetical protein
MKAVRKLAFIATVASIALGAVLPANADTVLLDLEDPAGTITAGSIGTSYALTFTAGTASTTISFAGYDVPSGFNVFNIGLFLNGAGPNLLSASWSFTAAAQGSSALVINAGTGLDFSGTVEDSFDTFSQAIATTVGQSYTLDFLFSTNGDPPSELVATASGASVTTPLPAALPLFAGGLGALGLLGWRRKRKAMASELYQDG